MKAKRGPLGGGLERRDFLRLVAGLPLVLGLPRLARAQDDGSGAGCDTPEGQPPVAPTSAGDLRAAITRARDVGRPVLLVLVPTRVDPEGARGGKVTAPARRQRIARRLHALLADPAERTRMLLANLTIVVAARDDLLAAVPALTKTVGAPAGASAGHLWLLDPTRDDVATSARALEARLDQDDAAASGLLADLDARVLPPEGARGAARSALLAPRAARERRALGADLALVEQALVQLDAEDFKTREAASARLAELVGSLSATLTWIALDSGNAEMRARARALVIESAREAVPAAGATWARFMPSCGANDPYDEGEMGMVDCGMARGGPAKPYLRLLAHE